MPNNLVRIMIVFLSFSFSNTSFGKEALTALQTIDNFYKQLLNYNYHETPNVKRPELKFSKSFKSAIERNAEVCKNYSTGICGWAADGDEYLNTQESDPLLNYENSGIKFREVSKNKIEVKLNVYPSETTEVEYYNRVIIFLMVQEGEGWVVDDILYGERNSSRKRMEKENADYIANPDPDSKMAKK